MRKADEQRLQVAEMRFWRRMLKISWKERRTNEEVLQGLGVGRELMSTVRSRQMFFLGHEREAMRREELEHLSLTGKIEGKRPQGRPRQKYMDGLVRVTGEGTSAAQANSRVLIFCLLHTEEPFHVSTCLYQLSCRHSSSSHSQQSIHVLLSWSSLLSLALYFTS